MEEEIIIEIVTKKIARKTVRKKKEGTGKKIVRETVRENSNGDYKKKCKGDIRKIMLRETVKKKNVKGDCREECARVQCGRVF